MTGAGWGLLDCDVADPAATYDDLEAAVRGAHEYIGQKEAGLNSSFERVYTMTDYYDGPRGGIASFRGRPHVYESMFADARDAYSDVFELRPVDDETFRLALEDWEMWLRWEDAFARGATSIETHPALPVDRARHDELAPLLASRLAARSNLRSMHAPSFVRYLIRRTQGAAVG